MNGQKQWRYSAILVTLAALALNACNAPRIGNSSSPPAPIPELPAGGVDVIGADTFAALQGSSSDAVKLETITVQGQSFQNAWRVTGLKPIEQPYFSQLSADTRVVIAKDDVMVVQFWARKGSAQSAQTEFVFEQNIDPYSKSTSVGVRLTDAWTLYSLPFRATSDYASGAGSARFRLGYNNQSFELGGVVVKNYAKTKQIKDLPFLGFSYAGREANAAWRAAAQTRIDQIRKADVRIKVVDSSNQPVPNATVKIQMKRHAFPFGSAVDAERLLGSSSDSQKYKKTILELFNRVVLENDLKWPNWESYSRTRVLEALAFFKANDIPVRGHNLIWPCNDADCLPTDVPPLLTDKTKLRSRIDAHLVDVLGATKGQIVEWDAVNEPSANKRLDKVLGEDEIAAWFKRAKQLDPTAKLFLNDYGNLGEDNLDVEYKRIIKRVLQLGAPLEGIGFQGHFGVKVTPPEELYTRLQDFAALGLPLAITEFDVNTSDEQFQADYLRDFMTVVFSTQGVDSFLMWGFWQGQHWLPDAALYRQDWTIKPNGQVFKDLVFKTWWTNVSGQSDSSGSYSSRGFLGDYDVTVTANGKTITQKLKLEKNSPELVVKLP